MASRRDCSENHSNGRLKINFNGWKRPPERWKQWVNRLALTKAPIWEVSGIFEAIMAPTYEIRRDEAVMIGLIEFWCPTMNTFVFPFGEATITLEDLLGLGGYSVFGEPVSMAVSGKLLEITEKMTQKHRWFTTQTSEKKASFSSWMNHFMESSDGDEEVEHVGFLILWLSRYVFPVNSQSVSKHVFSVAVHLAQGTRIALAPAVLATIYRDLRTLNEHVMASYAFPCTVWAPFQLLQLWAWERFVLLRPVHVNGTKIGDPLVAKWHKLRSNMSLTDVRSIVRKYENFQWRCYGTNVENEMWFSGEQKMLGFELIGIDCEEKYFPHRAAKQFGVDEKKEKISTEKLNGQVLINDEIEHKGSLKGLGRSTELPSKDIDDNLTFSERLKLVNTQSDLSDSIDHLPPYKRMELLQRRVPDKKSPSNCGEKPSSSVQDQSLCLSIQSETSVPSTVTSELRTTTVSDEHLLAAEDECKGLENRVWQLEKAIAGIKARLKAKVRPVVKK